MSAPAFKLEELFAGVEMRVEERSVSEDGERFIVLGKSPTTFGAEVPVTTFQFKPHAMAFAALPEIVDALFAAFCALEDFQKRDPGRNVPESHDAACNRLIEVFKKAEGISEPKGTSE